MSILKKGIAILLSALLVLPTIPVSAATEHNIQVVDLQEETLSYNLGTQEIMLLSPSHKLEAGEKLIDEKNVYVIEVEEDAFFPYEVQFTYNGETTRKWFMSQEDIVEIGPYQFGIHSDVTGYMVTEMTLNVAGKEVVVFPEEKNFTSGEPTFKARSLMPIVEKSLSADLTGFTPVECKRISISSIFAGETEINQATAKVIFQEWDGDDDYQYADLSDEFVFDAKSSSSYYSPKWEMIVGNIDQLDMSNVRYIVTGQLSSPYDWLKAKTFLQGSDGSRSEVEYTECSYYISEDYDYDMLYISIPDSYKNENNLFFSCQLADSFSSKKLKAFEGTWTTEAELLSATDISEKFFCEDMGQQDAGCSWMNTQYITLVSYGENDEITGIRPIRLNCYYFHNGPSIISSLYNEYGGYVPYETNRIYYLDNEPTTEFILYSGTPANNTYYIRAYFNYNGNNGYSRVTAAFPGKYGSIAEAIAAGASDIKEQLFSYNYNDGGYGTDYSEGVWFSIFEGEDNSDEQKVYYHRVKVTEGTRNPNEATSVTAVQRALYNGTAVTFEGLKNSSGQLVKSYCIKNDADSYGNYNFRTILVEKDVDLSNLAPIFTTSKGVNLYTEGGSIQEESGISVHDFSNGILQYTAAAENGSDSANYWLQIVKQTSEPGLLYMNSLADDGANTGNEEGIVYSTREVVIDSLHNDRHDLFLVNLSESEIQNLGLELTSDVLELDQYWTLTGNHPLSGFSTIEKTKSYGELANLAMLRFRLKEGIAEGSDIAGTLTIKSGDTPLMVITLTGTVGNPRITTSEVPQAVKYVPYGTMIQNNNKYSWNKTTYELVSGRIPEGMELKANGELYGVPKEFGEFTFSVRMRNSYIDFTDSEQQITLTIKDNTDENVDDATDEGYDVTTRIADVSDSDTVDSYLFVSEGVFSEFVDIYIDGNKLARDTDYSAESGSTRITIKSQTMKGLSNGTHTIGVEFRTGSNREQVKSAAQNVKVIKNSSGSNPGSGSGSNPGSNPGNNPGNNPGSNPGSNPGNNPGSNPGSESGDDSSDNGTTENGAPGSTPNTSDDSSGKPSQTVAGSTPQNAVQAVKKVVTVSWLDKSGKPIKSSFVATNKGKLVYVDKNGVMKQGKAFTVKGKRYYASTTGEIVKNGFFVTERGNTVYATKTGELKVNTIFKVNGKRYIAREKGTLVKNKWYTIGKKKYYCNKNGVIKDVKKIK